MKKIMQVLHQKYIILKIQLDHPSPPLRFGLVTNFQAASGGFFAFRSPPLYK
jgi:hypothetical protein